MALTAPDSCGAHVGGRLGQALRALRDGEPCGDQLGCWITSGGLRLALADGLGHGREAHAAAATAMHQLAAECTEPALDVVFARCDQRLLNTRGVALAVVDICGDDASIQHAAVGNVRTLLVQDDRVKRLGGARGIVGAGFSSLRTERLTINPGDWLIIFSDGIRENAGIVDCLVDAQPSDQFAEGLLARWADERDDASLLLYRHR
ncbi:SpoIIE family protein phosphatase [Thiocystis violascens]|uniref:Stage II sporulation protein E (SpoIIE) n=1 Tax=Thiocystis violascens (strain ATCC 17096 / DSM 198 / 6111) TaxID=765911 RepID=I3Y5Y6_THIV6|nr:SpoIIE family protein phosphatase [Thiocystis violascens]AFL72404.1 Stage II sporulation protein E (SpoIIE) [Thiocystis violascens DSM 198]